MKPNELRIGNWVIKTEVRYSGLKSFEYQIQWGIELTHAEGYDPIPLTGEILERCGYLSTLNHYWDEKMNFFLHDDGLRFVKSGETIVTIKHLHQLQNLVFALTNEELNYKPELC